MNTNFIFIDDNPNRPKKQPKVINPLIKLHIRQRNSLKMRYPFKNNSLKEGRCYLCGILSSPCWRRGPAGAKSLCNACGLHYNAMLIQEKKIPITKVPKPIPVYSLLNPVKDK